MFPKVLVIGAQNIDIFAKTDTVYVIADSNISKIHLAYGGVGRNIAENLKRLNHEVHFMTVFGDDDFSKSALLTLTDIGIDTTHSLFLENRSNSVYLGVLDKDNDLFLGLNDMGITNELNVDFFKTKNNFINSFEVIILDNNLSKEAISYLLKEYQHKQIIIDAVSAKKAVKLKDNLKYINTLKVNHIELAALSNKDTTLNKVKDIIKTGLKTVIVTHGSRDIIYYSEGELTVHSPHVVTNVVNATGAGDGFISGYISALLNKKDVTNRLLKASTVAYITLFSNNSTNKDLSNIEVEKTYEKLSRI